jgi:Zn-finger nucleic acid-binding protein
MHCSSCGAFIEPSGVFPGGTLVCACGTPNTVAHEHHARPNPTPNAPAPTRAPVRASAESNLQKASGAQDDRLECPRCHRALVRGGEQGEIVEVCSHCDGSFILNDALARLIEAAHAREDAYGDQPDAPPKHALERDVRYLPCPRCRETMARMNFGHRSGIMVDICRTHGTWFDRGELDAVLDYVARGGLSAEDFASAASAASPSPPPNDDIARMTKAAQALLQQEAILENAKIEAATDLVDDVLYVLFPVSRAAMWRRRDRF